MKKIKIMYIAIGIVCVIAVILAIYIQLNKNLGNNNKEYENTYIEEETQEELKKSFNNLFNNSVDFADYDTSSVPKFDDTNEIVYTVYNIEQSEDNKYEVDIHLPVININNEVGASFNNITQKIFADKATEVLQNSKTYTIYSVNYTGYINGDVLSVVIRSTLKEGSSAQRIIVQTYNYNLATGEEIDIYDAIKQIGATTDEVTSKIKKEITQAIKEANKIQASGYETFVRDINSDIYNLENVTTFFIGNDQKLHIIFAYGNDHFTSEMDIIEIM